MKMMTYDDQKHFENKTTESRDIDVQNLCVKVDWVQCKNINRIIINYYKLNFIMIFYSSKILLIQGRMLKNFFFKL
jgi:hypothetical protein